MRLAMRATVALKTAPNGFTARDLPGKVRALGGLADHDYNTRPAGYDLKKLGVSL